MKLDVKVPLIMIMLIMLMGKITLNMWGERKDFHDIFSLDTRRITMQKRKKLSLRGFPPRP